MKLISAISLIFLLLIQSACGSVNTDDAQQYSGILKPAGITSYQYGTHRLETSDTFYALKSDQIDLKVYEDEKVTITASKIQGYPVDGGPVYLDVKNVDREQ
ncbi:hypothetical protein [Christiangramia sediminis]|uniref:Uncharacterized protein n=1 Tax=Christiangramia sediminis TaxID=2881336 RepID=A0A9X1LKF4_9FLAO|nr:hypothetical protein [Christiangramia sediminis]MCB7482039.1 hypothetical protein [Christiangramia sediminis]